MTSTRLLLRCLTIFTRCDSPPESVSVSRFKVEILETDIHQILQSLDQRLQNGRGVRFLDGLDHIDQLARLPSQPARRCCAR